MKVEGPWAHRGGFRCRLVSSEGRRWCPTGRTEALALRLAEDCLRGALQQGGISLDDAIEAYLTHQREDKLNRESSVITSGHVLRRFFAPMIREPLSRLTPRRGADLYEQLRQRPGPRGKRLAVDSQRNYLAQARSLLSWCTERGWIRSNPLAAVKAVGKRQHGKPQLRIDERRRLSLLCLREAKGGDDGAMAVLLALWMGLRASEIVSRTVRDLDDGGTVLWVDDNAAVGFRPKTEAGRRAVAIPEELQPLLHQRAVGKSGDALLMTTEEGGAHWRDWVRDQTHRLCRLAGVPLVCAHSLRGTASTAAAQAGVAPHLVAMMLGHESAAITRRSYVEPGTFEHVERQQALRVLRGGRT